MVELFYGCLAGILAMIVGYSWYYGITPTPTSAKVKHQLIHMLPELAEGHIAELGSGWGTLAFALARHFSQCQVFAYEISPLPFFIAKLLAYYFASPNVSLIRQDFFTLSFEKFDFVVCYLYPGAMTRLKVKFERELKPEAYVLSHTFAVPGWRPLHVQHVADLYHTPIYLYQVKFSVKSR